MTPEDVVFKLGQLEPDEIARLMKDQGVLAVRSCSTACAVTQYVYEETRSSYISTGIDNLVYGPDITFVELPDSVRQFVVMFDDGVYPELDALNEMNQVA